MDIEKICELFELISSADSEENMPYITLAKNEVLSLLKDSRDAVQECVEYLAAAVANLHYCEAVLTREQHAVTMGGGATATYPDNSRVENARLLVASWKKTCSAYVKDNGFVFVGTNG